MVYITSDWIETNKSKLTNIKHIKVKGAIELFCYSKLIEFFNMFTNVVTIDLTGLDISHIENLSNLFKDCIHLTEVIIDNVTLTDYIGLY